MYYAHSFDRDGEYWCVLDAKGHIVSAFDDMTCRDAHRLASEMNDDLDEQGRAVLENIANNPSLSQAAE